MFHRWPQGRVIRIAMLVICCLIAVDIGLQGAWGQLSASQGGVMNQVLGWGMAGVALIILVGGIAAVGFVPRSADFLIEVEQEMVRVTWPKMGEVVRFTIIITVMSVVLALIIMLCDIAIVKLILGKLIGAGG